MENKKKICLDDINENWFVENIFQKENKSYLFFKIIIDALFSCVGFILFILLLPFFALLIKIDSKGSVLYKQERVGKNGRSFMIYKFRTMYENFNKNDNKWREKNKNSITKVGKFLRISHLDELPQSLNIFKGELSFIGPRAEWVELAKIFEKEIPFYEKRYLIKPGLIGWAQINFPASHSIEEAREKFQYDLYYIKNRSLILDLEIILKAIKLFFL